jgi:hypothetical protein
VRAIRPFVLIAAVSLLWVGLWQLEMLFVQYYNYWNGGYMLPFGIEVPWWFARDLFYGMIVLAFILQWFVVETREPVQKVRLPSVTSWGKQGLEQIAHERQPWAKEVPD